MYEKIVDAWAHDHLWLDKFRQDLQHNQVQISSYHFDHWNYEHVFSFHTAEDLLLANLLE